MLQFLYFLIFFFAVAFMLASLRLNKKVNKQIVSFSLFLFLLLLWTIVGYVIDNIIISFNTRVLLSNFEMVFMLSFAPVYLLFIYYLVEKKLDKIFWFNIVLNYAAIFARYLLPMDTSKDDFWRIQDPIIAMIFATAFTLPIITAMYMNVSKYVKETDKLIKLNLGFNLMGITIASLLSIFSELILPVFLNIEMQIHLINIAVLIFVMFAYKSLSKYGFLESNLGEIYEGIFDDSSTGVVILDNNFKIIRHNIAFLELLGYDKTIKGNHINDYLIDFVVTKEKIVNGIFTLRNKNKVLITSNQLESKFYNTVLTISDFNEINTKIEKIENENLTDYLTSIPNRKSFFNEVYEFVKKENYRLIMIDLNNFKKINDIYGHATGDQVLIQFSKKLITSLTDGHVYRLGGDEFAVLLPVESIVNFDKNVLLINNFLVEFDKELSLAYGSVTITKENTNAFNKVEEQMKVADKQMYLQKTKKNDASSLNQVS